MNSLKYKFDPAVIAANFPPELRRERRWVVAVDKKPQSSISDRGAKQNDPSTWRSFAGVCEFARIVAAKNPKKTVGIGFQFGGLTEVFGIDLDHCRDPETGIIEPFAEKIIRDFGTYAEFSQSGTGIHIVGIGKKPGKGCKKGQIEIYGNGPGRYFVITGNRIPGCPASLTACQQQLDALHRETFGDESAKPAAHTARGKCGCHREPTAVAPDDQKIISRIENSRVSAKFRALWAGDTSGHGGDHSRADLALCSLLAYWTGPDSGRIDSLFRQSGLRRDKWDRPDYRDRTIDMAITGCSSFYEWKTPPKVAPQPVAAKGDADARKSSSIHPPEIHRSTLTVPVHDGDFLAPGIERPAMTERWSECRKVVLALTSRANPNKHRIAGFACRQHHGCEQCKHIWRKDRLEWFFGVVSQFQEIFSTTTSTPAESKAVYQKIVRRAAKGENAIYVKIPLASGQELWLTNCPTKTSKQIDLHQLEEALDYAIADVPPGRRIGCTRGLAFYKAKEPPTGEWKRDEHQPGLARVSMDRLAAAIKEHFGKVRDKDVCEKEKRSLTYEAPSMEAVQKMYRDAIPGYFGPAPTIRIRPRAERAAFVLLSPMPTG